MSGWSDSGCHRMWDCLCDCGIAVRCAAHQLLSSKTRSCGCLIKDSARIRLTTHGELLGGGQRSPEYTAWKNMHQRCENQNRREYGRYGGRGIKVCERWMRFDLFLADMGRRPTSKHSLERLNNDGNYEPSNCCWGTAKDQCRNRSTTRHVEFRGQRMSLAAAAERAGLSYDVVRARLYRLEWSVEESLTRTHRYAT
jgi:hypothetical protein